MAEEWSRFESGDMESLCRFLGESRRDIPMRLILKSEHWGPEACDLIAAAEVGSCLRFLSIRGTLIGDGGINALVAGDTLASLNCTCIERSGITDAGLASLVLAPSVQGLRELCVGNREGVETGKPNEIGDGGAFALVHSPYLGNLTDLDLCNTEVGDSGFEAIFRWALSSKLTSVIAWGTRLTREGWETVKSISSEQTYRTWIHTDFDVRSVEY